MIKKLIKHTLCSTVVERIISILILAVTLLSCVGYSQVSFPPFISLPDSHLSLSLSRNIQHLLAVSASIPLLQRQWNYPRILSGKAHQGESDFYGIHPRYTCLWRKTSLNCERSLTPALQSTKQAAKFISLVIFEPCLGIDSASERPG